MVKTIVYFTRTNTSKRVAEKIAKELNLPIVQVTDDKNWNGLIGYIKAGFYSTVHKSVKIQVQGTVDEVNDIVFIAPLWAGGLAPAALEFLKKVGRDKVHMVVVSLGSYVKDRSGFKSLYEITDQEGNEDSVIRGLVNDLQEKNESEIG